MTTADWALIISICSAFVALLSFVWNVWSKFIYPKPTLVVGFTLHNILDADGLSDPFLNLSVTNHGPVACTVTHSFVHYNGLFRRRRIGLINPLSNFPHDFETTQGPFSGGLPKKIEVGEQFSLHYWYGQNWLDEKGMLRVGVFDSFNRKHLCSRSNVRQVQKEYLKDKAAGKLAKETPRQ